MTNSLPSACTPPMVKSSSSSRTRNAHALKPMILNNTSNANVGHASCADHRRPTRTPPWWETLNVICALIRHLDGALIRYEKSRKIGLCRGVKDNLQDMNELQGKRELFWNWTRTEPLIASMQLQVGGLLNFKMWTYQPLARVDVDGLMCLVLAWPPGRCLERRTL